MLSIVSLAFHAGSNCHITLITGCKFAGTLLAVELILFGFVEAKRYVDFRKPGSQVQALPNHQSHRSVYQAQRSMSSQHILSYRLLQALKMVIG